MAVGSKELAPVELDTFEDDRLIDELGRRLAGDPDLLPGQAAPAKPGQQPHAGCGFGKRTRTSDEQQMPAIAGSDVGQLFQRATAELDARQAGNRKRREGGKTGAHAGKSPFIGSPRRGSAIMPATASRQAR